MKKVLILGDGLLGSEIQRQTGWDLISRKKDGFDITHPDSLEKFVISWIDDIHFGRMGYAVEYDIILNCIAHTQTYSDDKNTHWDVNYKGVSYLVDFCNKFNIKLIHISTEFVYSNNPENSFPDEESLPHYSNNWYSYTKVLADEYIKLKSNNYLICRELHKPNPFIYPEVWDVNTSGDTVDKIANLIITLINKDAQGVYNVGTGGKNLSELSPNSKIIPPPSYVPKDTRMNLTKLNQFLNG